MPVSPVLAAQAVTVPAGVTESTAAVVLDALDASARARVIMETLVSFRTAGGGLSNRTVAAMVADAVHIEYARRAGGPGATRDSVPAPRGMSSQNLLKYLTASDRLDALGVDIDDDNAAAAYRWTCLPGSRFGEWVQVVSECSDFLAVARAAITGTDPVELGRVEPVRDVPVVAPVEVVADTQVGTVRTDETRLADPYTPAAIESAPMSASALIESFRGQAAHLAWEELPAFRRGLLAMIEGIEEAYAAEDEAYLLAV